MPASNTGKYLNKYPHYKKKTNTTRHNSPSSRENIHHWKTNRHNTVNSYYASSSKLIVGRVPSTERSDPKLLDRIWKRMKHFRPKWRNI
jgi:hypothetical protein